MKNKEWWVCFALLVVGFGALWLACGSVVLWAGVVAVVGWLARGWRVLVGFCGALLMAVGLAFGLACVVDDWLVKKVL